MTAEIKKLNVAKNEINEHAVEMIEQLLSSLKSGESVAVAIVEVRKANTVATGWSPHDGSYHLLNSGASRLANRLSSEADDY